MKLLFMLLLACVAMPLFAQQNAIESIPDTIENRRDPGVTLPQKKTIPQNSPLRKRAAADIMLSQKDKMKMGVMKVYSCPAHPFYHAEKPGRCPECSTLLSRTTKGSMKTDLKEEYGCTRHTHISGERGTICGECGRSLTRLRKRPATSASNKKNCSNRSLTGNCLSCKGEPMLSAKEKMKMDVMKSCCCLRRNP